MHTANPHRPRTLPHLGGHPLKKPAGVPTSGKPVAHFTVISDSRYRDRDTGEWTDAGSTAVRVTAWGTLAEAVADQLTKGAKVTVTGHKLAAAAYINRDGEAAAALEIVADQVSLDLRQPAGRS
ncbi:MAG: single-stranded DNA-binding protein [Streptosporangiales bacterium]